MNLRGNGERPVIRHKSTRLVASPNTSVGRWYPIALVFEYRAYSDERLVQSGAGQTIEISSRGLRLRIPEEISSEITEVQLAIAWPVLLNGVTPLQWSVKAQPAWRAPGWIFVCIASHEFRTAGGRSRLAMAACG